MACWGHSGRYVTLGLLDFATGTNVADKSPIGITIGAVVVPQGMASAKLANLDVQFGLYSSFVGVLLYWAFGTSKDINIGVSNQPNFYNGVVEFSANCEIARCRCIQRCRGSSRKRQGPVP